MDSEIYNQLTRYCAYQERCTSDVIQKLKKLKATQEDFDAYTERLKEENYLNEERFVRAFIRGHSRKRWGKTKIKSALLQKRISATLIKKHLDVLDEKDYSEQIKILAEKKWKSLKADSLPKKKQKTIRFLMSRGFESGKIMEVIKALK